MAHDPSNSLGPASYTQTGSSEAPCVAARPPLACAHLDQVRVQHSPSRCSMRPKSLGAPMSCYLSCLMNIAGGFGQSFGLLECSTIGHCGRLWYQARVDVIKLMQQLHLSLAISLRSPNSRFYLVEISFVAERCWIHSEFISESSVRMYPGSVWPTLKAALCLWAERFSIVNQLSLRHSDSCFEFPIVMAER